MDRVARRLGKFALFVCVPAVLVGVITAALLGGWWRSTPVAERCTAAVQDYRAELTFEEAENAALIADISVRRGMPARAATIALATAYQESGLINIEDGHLDSIGLFQQRPSKDWGTAEQISDPHYATNRFYAALEKVDGYEQMEITDAAQEVQISAAGEAYAQHENASRALASAFTGQSPAAFTCQVRDVPSESASSDEIGAELTKTIGDRTIDAEADKVRVQPNEGGADAWVVAHWAVANADRFGITSVSYADRSWTAESSTDGWQRTEGKGAATGRVVLGLDD